MTTTRCAHGFPDGQCTTPVDCWAAPTHHPEGPPMTNPIAEGRREALIVRAVTCPKCGAQPGQRCTSRTGTAQAEQHVARAAAAGYTQTRAARRNTGRKRGRPLSRLGARTRSVPCPTCGVGTGIHCTTPKGTITAYHAARILIAFGS